MVLVSKLSSAYRLSDTCLRLIAALAQLLGLSKTGVVETAIRHFAEHKGVKDEQSD